MRSINKAILWSAGLIMAASFSCARDDMHDFYNFSSYDDFPVAILMYNGGVWQGNLGGRTGADEKCRMARGLYHPYTEGVFDSSRVFLSVDAVDIVASMPFSYGVPTSVPIIGPNGVVIASNWADLLDGNILPAGGLLEAGVVPGVTLYWMASGPVGDLVVGQECAGWTSNFNGDSGSSGISTGNDNTWINNSAPPCDSIQYLLCIAW